MIDLLKNKIRELYDELIKPEAGVVNTFVEYFGEALVDSDLVTFEEVLGAISKIPFRVRFAGWKIEETSDTVSFILGNSRITMSRSDAKEKANMLFVDACTASMLEGTSTESWLGSQIQALIRYCTIKVHFPEVRVTNEHDKFVDIQDLYAMVNVDGCGRLIGVIKLHRATYTTVQYLSNYAHSHLPGIPEDWREPCFGSGPLVTTMRHLQANYDLNFWGLLCYELSKFVTVESLSGVPYRRLEDIGADQENNDTRIYQLNYCDTVGRPVHRLRMPSDGWLEFLTDFVKNEDFKFSYYNGQYYLGEAYLTIWIKLSRAFARWYNKEVIKGNAKDKLPDLLAKNVLQEYIVTSDSIYRPQSQNAYNRVHEVDGNILFTFKGEPVRLTIIDADSLREVKKTYLINRQLLNWLITNILKVINCRYGREDETETATEKKYCYI